MLRILLLVDSKGGMVKRAVLILRVIGWEGLEGILGGDLGVLCRTLETRVALNVGGNLSRIQMEIETFLSSVECQWSVPLIQSSPSTQHHNRNNRYRAVERP